MCSVGRGVTLCVYTFQQPLPWFVPSCIFIFFTAGSPLPVVVPSWLLVFIYIRKTGISPILCTEYCKTFSYFVKVCDDASDVAFKLPSCWLASLNAGTAFILFSNLMFLSRPRRPTLSSFRCLAAFLPPSPLRPQRTINQYRRQGRTAAAVPAPKASRHLPRGRAQLVAGKVLPGAGKSSQVQLCTTPCS